ncbi:MAG TPA: hypothetical protein VIJ42_18220 [Stellaceae bacterium]
MAHRKVPHPERARRALSRDARLQSRLRALTDADIEKAAAEDPDTFMPDAEWFKRARVVVQQPNKT